MSVKQNIAVIVCNDLAHTHKCNDTET